MARGPQRLGAFARELAAGKKPLDAALAAGYPDSNCAPRNARRRAARADFKAMVAELKLSFRNAGVMRDLADT